MKKGIIYWIASCVWMLFSLPLQANDQTVWPEEGLIALWDFTKDRTEDLIGKKKIHYREAYSYEKSVDLRFDTLSNGRIGLSTKCTLPFILSTLPDTTTLVLCYAPSRGKEKSIDSKLLTMGRLGDLLMADNGTLELKGYIDSTYTTHIKYEVPMSCDKDGYVRIIFSVYALSYPFKSGFHFMQGVSVSGSQYWSYRNISIEFNRASDSIYIHTPSALMEVAVYRGLLNEKKQAVLMGTDKVTVFRPDDDHTSLDWRCFLLMAFIAFVILQGIKQRRNRYKAVSRQWIINKYYAGTDSRGKALEHISRAWEAFGSANQPMYPETDAQMATAVQELDIAIATGCADDDVIEEYNKLGTLVNHCREYSYVGRFSFYMAVFLLIFASLEPLSDRNFMYTIHTYGFYVYYVAALAILVGGFGERYRAFCGKPIKNSVHLLSAKRIGTFVGQASMATGVTFVGIVSLFVGAIVTMLKIMLSCIFEFAIVVVRTGSVIATGFTGFGAGMIIAFVVMLLLGWLFYYIFIAVLWCMVLGLPILSYYLARRCDVN